jgi:hypothetical protein
MMRCTCEQARREARIEAIKEVLALPRDRHYGTGAETILLSDIRALLHPPTVPPRRHAECHTVCQVWGSVGGCAPGVCALLAQEQNWRTTPPDYPEPELGSPT